MKVDYDAKKDRFSVTDLTNSEAGALAGALSFAIEEIKSTGLYEIIRKEGGNVEAVENIADQLTRADFMRLEVGTN